MNFDSATGLALAVLTSFSLGGCIGGSEEPWVPEEDVGDAQQAVVITNQLTTNSLTTNSLTTNSLTTNSLTTNSLTTNSLTTNSLVMSALSDSRSREVLKYVVSCALPPTSSVEFTVSGQTYHFDGGVGVWPSWNTMPCTEDCKQVVSGCVISRINYLGQQVNISIRSWQASSMGAGERTNYTHLEAAYVGNIFAQPQQLYLCLPPGATSVPRVCGPSLTGCAVQSVGQCNCGVTPDNAGYYLNCTNFPQMSRGYLAFLGYNDWPTTVFLR